MNAYNNVNLAAACVLTSVDYAQELGIPRSKWIYPLGGAGTRDSLNCEPEVPFPFILFSTYSCPLVWERPNFYSSPSISDTLDAVLSVSGVRKEQIDLYDFYSYAVDSFLEPDPS